MAFTDIDMIRINEIIKRLIERFGIDKITHFLMGETTSFISLLLEK